MTVHDRCIVKPHVKPFYPELRMLPYEHEKILTFNRKTKEKKNREGKVKHSFLFCNLGKTSSFNVL